MKRPRVLFVVTAFPRHEGDVITPWLWTLTRELVARGVEIDVLASGYRGMKDHEAMGMRIYRWRYAPAPLETLSHDVAIPEKLREGLGPKIAVLPFVFGGVLKAISIAKKERYDLVHVHWPFPFALLSLPFKVPRVYTFYTAEIALSEKMNAFRGLFQSLVNKAAALTFLTTYGLERFQRSYRIPQGCEVAVIPYMPARESVPLSGLTREARKLLFVGRLVERKGVIYLLRALALLTGDYPDIKLVIVGTGPEHARLRAEASRLGIQKHVEFLGSVSDEERERQYATAGLFVLPAVVDSRGDTEGQGVVLLEAMRAGCPVIASSVGGITDLIEPGKTGLLVPQKDPRALAQAIKHLLDNPHLAQGMVGAARLALGARFSPKAVGDATLSLYSRLLDRRM